MSKLSVYILAYNEEPKVEAAIKSVTWADEVIVVDSGSTDKTARISKKLGAKVVEAPFEGFGRLRNMAIAACKNEWIFSLDADERCTPGAAEEIKSIIGKAHPFDAYYVPRRNWFMGKWIRHSGWYPDYRQPQLFKRETLIFHDEDEVHEGYEIIGTTGYLKNPIWQFPFKNFAQLQNKANRYSSLGAVKLQRRKVRGGMTKALCHAVGAFLRIYFLERGFLDGWAGFVIALGNFEGTFYRYAKLTEIRLRWDRPPADHNLNLP
ncbi:MAG: glycosyltransferase family 2 protein [Deltaproteobacteria bacterium]|nr:glycosyltransferase family 2 protein [Deltaproteobacteria bacterium]